MIYEIAGLRIFINNRCKYTEAFCKAYLAAGLTGEEELIEKSVGENTENENGLFAVRIRYIAIQRWNL